jgi:hypothetical protein
MLTCTRCGRRQWGSVALRQCGNREACDRRVARQAPELDPDATDRDDRDDRPERRRLTTYERHQAAADAGVDTWEDYRGER